MAVDIIARGMASSGGGSGVSDYNQLTNKPKINGIELAGDVNSSSLGLPQYDGDTINLNVESKMQTVGIKDQKTGGADKFWTGTKAEYDALTTHDENTFYAIIDDNNGSDTFIITLTPKQNGDYTSDKTYDEIIGAYRAKKVLLVCIGDSQLPLMNGEIGTNGNLGLTFGFTRVQSQGQSVATRAVHYLHSGVEDIWEDADDSGEYLSQVFFDITLTKDPTAGLLSNKTIAEIKEAIASGLTVRAIYNNTLIPLVFVGDDTLKFTLITDNLSTTITCISDVWTITSRGLLETAGGEMDGNINMKSNSLLNVQKIHVDGEAPIYIGSTIESSAPNAPRLSGTTSGEAAFVMANTQDTYASINIGSPKTNTHATTKLYVDDKIKSIFSSITGYDGSKTQILKNINGVLTWVNES